MAVQDGALEHGKIREESGLKSILMKTGGCEVSGLRTDTVPQAL